MRILVVQSNSAKSDKNDMFAIDVKFIPFFPKWWKEYISNNNANINISGTLSTVLNFIVNLFCDKVLTTKDINRAIFPAKIGLSRKDGIIVTNIKIQ